MKLNIIIKIKAINSLYYYNKKLYNKNFYF